MNRRLEIIIITSLILFVLTVLINMDFSAFFFWDDGDFIFSNIVTNYPVKSIFLEAHYGMFHPVTTLILKLEYLFFGDKAIGYHVVSLCLHLITTLFAYRLISLHINNRFLRLFALLLFLFHPLNIEVTNWITSQKDLISTLFAIIGLVQYELYLKNNKKSNLLNYNALLLLSILSKPQFVILPIILFVIYYFKTAKFSLEFMKRNWLLIVASLIIFIVNVVIRIDSDTSFSNHISHFEHLILVIKSYSHYIIKILLPYNLSIFYQFDTSNILSINLIINFLVIIGVASLFYFFQKNRIVFMYLLLLNISYLPFIQVFRIGESMANDRYTHFFTLLLGILIAKILETINLENKNLRNGVKIVIGSYILVIVILFFIRHNEWSDVKKLALIDLKKQPNSEILNNSVGVHYLQNQQVDSSKLYFEKAINIDSNYTQAIFNLGLSYTLKGDIKQSIACFNKAISIKNNYREALYRASNIYYNAQNYDSCYLYLKQIGNYYKLDARENDLLGRYYLDKENFSLARAHFSEACHLDPQNVNFLYNLANIEGRLGDYDSAIQNLDKCININNNFYLAYYLRGLAKIYSGKNGCSDLFKAANANVSNAKEALNTYCSGL